ncbi:MAG: GNAT family N-acetyltransferase [Methyloligellaceae bacterium]
MGEITIREAMEADMARISAIYGRSVETETASFELEPPDEREMAKRWRALVDAGYPYIVAADQGAVVGYAYVGPYRSRPAYRHVVECTVYIAPEVQRRGVGRRLLQELIEQTEACGFRQMIAIVGGSEHRASIEFHRALGFDVVGTLRAVGHKHGTWLDTVFLQRALGAGSTTPPERP